MRFYVSYTNRRGKTYGAGTKAGYGTHTRGWHAGVRVTPLEGHLNGVANDLFDIEMTSGSAGGGNDVHLGRVIETPDGPRFVPDEALLGLDSAPSWVQYALDDGKV